MNKLSAFLKSPSAKSFAIKTLSYRNLNPANFAGKDYKNMSRNELLDHLYYAKKRRDPTLLRESPEQRMKRLTK